MFNHTVSADFSTLRFFAILPIVVTELTEYNCQSVCVKPWDPQCTDLLRCYDWTLHAYSRSVSNHILRGYVNPYDEIHLPRGPTNEVYKADLRAHKWMP